jgi:hypothetical protein
VGRRPQGKDRTGGVTEHRRRPAGFLDEGFEILDLALDRVRERVATATPSAAIVVEDGEALLQGRGQGRARSPVVERADHQDDRRSLP